MTTRQRRQASSEQETKLKSFDSGLGIDELSLVDEQQQRLIEAGSRVRSPTIPQPMQHENFQRLAKHIDTFIFDADGVLWLGEGVIPGSPQFIDYLLGMGKRIIVLTNNATKSRATYAAKLHRLGYSPLLSAQHIVNPSAVTADLLQRAGIAKRGKKVYLMGEKGLRDELDRLSIEHFGAGPDPVEAQPSAQSQPFLYDLQLDVPRDEVGAVVIGYEKHFNYLKLMKAVNYLQQEDCLFVATNEDETCPGPNPATVIPDNGPIVAAVRCASGREPLVAGKPSTPAFDYIRRRWEIDPRRTMMIGDRTNTDVKFGHVHGMKTMLVLSGCHQVDEVVENQLERRDEMVPDFYAPCLGALLPQPVLGKCSAASGKAGKGGGMKVSAAVEKTASGKKAVSAM